MRGRHAGALIGAAFLMATSAIGPGFLTQTATFTARLGASFAFAIVVSVVIDLVAQLNIWRVLVVTGRRATDVADAVHPGLGPLLATLVALGGLAFNVGNVAGAGLGLEVVARLPVGVGAALSAGVAVVLFTVKEAGRAMDRFTVALGVVMVLLTGYVAVASAPPVGEAALRSVVPATFDVVAIVTIVGGTVGGYITFAGAHRLVDAGVQGEARLGETTRSAVSGIGIASVMRALLFLAALGVVTQGRVLDPANPAASVFRHATGELGYRVAGLVLWSAAITSVVGAAYTSVSFLRPLHPAIEAHWSRAVIAFVGGSTLIFLAVGQPVKVLVLVGALNGLILPVGLATMLVAAHRRAIVGAYRHPRALTALGVVVTVAMSAAGAFWLWRDLPRLWR